MSTAAPTVAIVDYGVGNLFSVARACERAGLTPVVTSDRRELLNTAAVVLPGVGAFGDAMAELRRLDLVGPLRDVHARGTPLLGVCLGMQLLMGESHEFGRHAGLGLIDGDVVRFENVADARGVLKVPQVGWSPIRRPSAAAGGADPWADTPLAATPDGACMYFVHSYYVRPTDRRAVLATSRYGGVEYCAAVRQGELFACQFHPEKSGPVGLAMYAEFARRVQHLSQLQEPRLVA